MIERDVTVCTDSGVSYCSGEELFLEYMTILTHVLWEGDGNFSLLHASTVSLPLCRVWSCVFSSCRCSS